jgi:hypothetical protein
MFALLSEITQLALSKGLSTLACDKQVNSIFNAIISANPIGCLFRPAKSYPTGNE